MESSGFPTASEIADLQTDTIIKEEDDLDHGTTEDMPLDIKSEQVDNTGTEEHTDDPFTQVQLEVKQEISISIEREGPDCQNEDSMSKMVDFDHESKEDLVHYATVPKCEMDCDEKAEVKEERVVGDESLVTYDYPNFDDVGSMDSNEAAALNQVEACLQDDMIKCEGYDDEVPTSIKCIVTCFFFCYIKYLQGF